MSRLISTIILCAVITIIWWDLRDRIDCQMGRASACAAIERKR